MNLKELLELRAKALAEIQRLRDLVAKENRAFNSEEEVAWAKCNADYDDLGKRIAVIQRGEAVEAEHREAANLSSFQTTKPAGVERQETLITEEHRMKAFNGWLRFQSGYDLTDEQETICKRLNFRPDRKELEIPLWNLNQRNQAKEFYNQMHPSRRAAGSIDFRALSAFTPTTGGYTVPSSFVNSLEVNMLAFGSVEQAAEVITTSGGERMAWPTADDTSNTGAQIGESVDVGSSVDPSFGQVYWDAYKFSSKPVLVPYELLQDSAFDIASLIGSMLGERLGRISNTRFTTGTGAGTCKGIVTASTVATLSSGNAYTASATAIAADEIIDLVHQVDPAYRNGAAFMFHDSILLHLRKLKDGQGNYLWQNGFNANAPDRLVNYPIYINQDMASSVAASNKTMLFGQLSKYKIRRVGGVRLYRMQERYRPTDQDGFVAFIRQDGNLLTAGTVNVRHMLQHA